MTIDQSLMGKVVNRDPLLTDFKKTFLLELVVKQTFLFKIRKEVDTQFLSKRKIELLSKSDKEKSFCFHHIFQNTNIIVLIIYESI